MPRRPKEPRYYPSRQGYYVQIGKVKHLLARGDKDDRAVIDEAWNNFHALMHVNAVIFEGDKATIYALIQKYLAWVAIYRKPNTLTIRTKLLQAFERKWGTLRVCDLKKKHLTEWLTDQSCPHYDVRKKYVRRWGPSTRNGAIASVQAMLNWAADEGIISKNPLGQVQRGASVSRAVMCMVTDEQHRLMMERLRRRRNEGFRNILIGLYHTGARPGEVACMEARHYNPRQRAWIIDANEERGNKLGFRGKRRVIYLNDEMVALVERLNEQHPTGPIFPNEVGAFYDTYLLAARFRRNRESINARFEAEGKPKPFPREVTLYGYRHRFVTDWLEAGKPVAFLADLLGTSIQMIQKHYSHLRERTESLRKELLNFQRGAAMGSTAGTPTPLPSDGPDA